MGMKVPMYERSQERKFRGTSVVTVAGICNSIGGGVLFDIPQRWQWGMHHALRVNHLSRSLPLTPHHNAHVNHRRRC